jgi:PAS domain S-box-containing protein
MDGLMSVEDQRASATGDATGDATSSEHERLRVLRSMELLDAPREDDFDRITRLATRLVAAPVSLLTLLDADRLFLLSEAGLGEPWASRRWLPSSHSHCADVVLDGRPLVLPDAREASSAAGSAAVRELGIVAYAGVPLSVMGTCLGALSTTDERPREWTDEQLAALDEVAALATGELELRATAAERDAALGALQDSEELMRLAFDAGAIGMVMVSLEPASAGRIVRVNSAFCEFLGRSEASLLGTHVADITHPADRLLSTTAVSELASGRRQTLRRLEKRYLHAEGHTVWGSLTTSSVTPRNGRRSYVISLVEDITDRKLSERHLPAIANVLRRIVSGDDPRETIVRAAEAITGAMSAHLVERTSHGTLALTAEVGAKVGPVEISVRERSATAHVYQTGEPLFLTDPAASPLVSKRHLELTNPASILWQPIRNGDRVVGVLVLCWAERVASLSASAAGAVSLLTDEIAVALAHHDALRRLDAQPGGWEPHANAS